MIKTRLLTTSIVGYLCLLLLLAACGPQNDVPAVSIPTTTQAQTTAPTVTPTPAQSPAITPTPTQQGFAAVVGSSGNPVNRTAQGDNLTTINAPVDRPVAIFTKPTLNVPAKAKGVVYIQNDSDNLLTLVSDTANGFAEFNIAPNTTTDLVFHRVGTFKAHLKGYLTSPVSTLTIIITMPSPD